MAVADTIWSLMVLFLVLDTIAVGMRAYTRGFISKSFSYDDWAMMIAMLGFILLCSFAFASLGGGYGSDAPTMEGAKFFIIAQLTYGITVIIAKVSGSLVLYRIASAEAGIRRLIEAGTGIFLLSMTALLFVIGFQCRPMGAAWGEVPGECISGETLAQVGYAFSAIDMALSWMHAILPAYMVWNVQISRNIKISIIVLLGLGIVSNIATIIRLKALVDLSNEPSTSANEIAEKYLATFIYSITEIGLTIFTASLAAIRPLLRKVPLFGSTARGENSASNNNATGASQAFADASRGTGIFKGKGGHAGADPIRLDDLHYSDDAGSQETILGSGGPGGIRKQTVVVIKHDDV